MCGSCLTAPVGRCGRQPCSPDCTRAVAEKARQPAVSICHYCQHCLPLENLTVVTPTYPTLGLYPKVVCARFDWTEVPLTSGHGKSSVSACCTRPTKIRRHPGLDSIEVNVITPRAAIVSTGGDLHLQR